MKFVGKLSDYVKIELQDLYKTGSTHRVRQRAHAVLLSSTGHTIDQMVTILGVSRNTISAWLDQ